MSNSGPNEASKDDDVRIVSTGNDAEQGIRSDISVLKTSIARQVEHIGLLQVGLANWKNDDWFESDAAGMLQFLVRYPHQKRSDYLLEDLRKEKEDLRKKEEDLRKKEEDLRKKEEDLRKEKEDLRKKEEDLRKEKEDLRKKKADLRKKEDDLRKEKEEDLRKEKEDLRNEEEDLRKKEGDLRNWQQGNFSFAATVPAMTAHVTSRMDGLSLDSVDTAKKAAGIEGDSGAVKFAPPVAKGIIGSKESLQKQRHDPILQKSSLSEKGRIALQTGKRFLKSIMEANLNVLPEHDAPEKIQYLRCCHITAGYPLTIVLIPEVLAFWRRVFSLTEQGYRVCAVGSPGIGKSTTMMYMIRFLLEQSKNVVYLVRTGAKAGFYLEFARLTNGDIRCDVHPETLDPEDIHILASDPTNSYYLCDSGKTKGSCDPSDCFKAHVIINASCDSRRWGGNEFAKRRDGRFGGIFCYYPVITYEELSASRTLFSDEEMSDEEFENRLRCFGRIPRNLFGSAEERSQADYQQLEAIRDLKAEMAKKIVATGGKLDSNNPSAPSSSIACMTSSGPNFNTRETGYVSDLARERVAQKHIELLWNDISGEDNDSQRGHLFEAYVRSLMTISQTFETRKCVGKKSPDYTKVVKVVLGGCDSVRRTTSMIADVKSNEEGTMFYSYNQREPLVDFMYKKGGTYFAFQVTISSSHSCAHENVQKFLSELRLGDGEEVKLFYTVPGNVFKEFVTDPVSPPNESGLSVFHCKVDRWELQTQTEGVEGAEGGGEEAE